MCRRCVQPVSDEVIDGAIELNETLDAERERETEFVSATPSVRDDHYMLLDLLEWCESSPPIAYSPIHCLTKAPRRPVLCPSYSRLRVRKQAV